MLKYTDASIFTLMGEVVQRRFEGEKMMVDLFYITKWGMVVSVQNLTYFNIQESIGTVSIQFERQDGGWYIRQKLD